MDVTIDTKGFTKRMHKSHNKIIFLDDIRIVKANLPKIRKILEQEGGTIVPLSDAVLLYLRGKGFNCVNYHDVISKEAYSDIYEKALYWGKNWYSASGEDATKVEGISLGCVSEWHMIYFFNHLLRWYLTVKGVLDKFKPSEVVVISTDKIDLTYLKVRWLNADIGLLPDIVKKTIVNMEGRPNLRLVEIDHVFGESLMARLKNGIKRILCPLTTVLSDLRQLMKGRKEERKKIVFFEAFHHFEDVMKRLAGKGIEVTHLQKKVGPSLLLKLLHSGVRIKVLSPDKDKEKFPLRDVDVHLKKDLSNFFVYKDVDFGDIVLRRINFLINTFFPKVMIPDLQKVRASLRALSPDCLVLENDSIYYERMFVLVAKAQGIKTVVLQHGMTWFGEGFDSRLYKSHDFYPVFADHIIVFGKVVEEWFKNLGQDSEKLVVKGGGIFDKYHQAGVNRSAASDKRKKVLFLLDDHGCDESYITQNIPLSKVGTQVSKINEMAKKNPDIDFVVRPHSSDLMDPEIFSWGNHAGNNFTISRDKTLLEMIKEVDLVVGCASTGLLEALTANVPVISMDVYNSCQAFALWEYGLSVRAKTYEETDHLIREMLFDVNKREKFLKDMKENIELFIHSTDGDAATRISDYIYQIVGADSGVCV